MFFTAYKWLEMVDFNDFAKIIFSEVIKNQGKSFEKIK